MNWRWYDGMILNLECDCGDALIGVVWRWLQEVWVIG